MMSSNGISVTVKSVVWSARGNWTATLRNKPGVSAMGVIGVTDVWYQCIHPEMTYLMILMH
jgi:hypothetical protein